MKSAIGSIVRTALYNKDSKINILSTPHHIKYMEKLCSDKEKLYMWEDPTNPFKEPTTIIHIINEQISILPKHIDFDVILCHDMLDQYKFIKPIAQLLHLPLIAMEHKTKEEYGNKLSNVQNIQVSDILFDSKEISDSWNNTNEHRIMKDLSEFRNKIERVLGKVHTR